MGRTQHIHPPLSAVERVCVGKGGSGRRTLRLLPLQLMSDLDLGSGLLPNSSLAVPTKHQLVCRPPLQSLYVLGWEANQSDRQQGQNGNCEMI